MKIYRLTRLQFLPATLQEAWDFFSTPDNLAILTPKRLDLEILGAPDDRKLYNGQIIRYKVRIMPGIKWKWVTEITNVDEPNQFVDEQRSGPYTYWHHHHQFKLVTGGVEMTDTVSYAIPFGIIGRLANRVFVAHEVNAIFDYRYTMLEKHFVRASQHHSKAHSL